MQKRCVAMLCKELRIHIVHGERLTMIRCMPWAAVPSTHTQCDDISHQQNFYMDTICGLGIVCDGASDFAPKQFLVSDDDIHITSVVV